MFSWLFRLFSVMDQGAILSRMYCPDFDNTSILNTENNYKRRYMLEMLQIIKVPLTQRINYRTDIENIAQNYRHLVDKK